MNVKIFAAALFDSGALHSAPTTAHETGGNFGAQPGHVPVRQNCLAGGPMNMKVSSPGEHPNLIGGGKATIRRQHHPHSYTSTRGQAG